ncbi:hypothetical protein [Streptomyces tendae]|uniref:hypothetical protein n=1 Tax=Streptomyces tendae TaxID=1932 RepID=UPI0036F92564
MSETTPLAPRERATPIEGREELDAAWGRFRKAITDLLREGLRSPDVLPALTPIVKEATVTLQRLTKEARAATAGSKRKREASAEGKLRKALVSASGKGSARAAALLEQLEAERRSRGRR